MLFNSIDFLIFFPIVTILFFLLPEKFRIPHLLLASCVFYMFFVPAYILILVFTIIIDYYAGRQIEKAFSSKKKKLYLVLSLIANIGILGIFKYYNFFAENINFLIGTSENKSLIPLLNILLPIGLSFHTFQAMSYTIEVFRGNQKAENDFQKYALYVLFYPQLVAGPIERPQNILPQFYLKHHFNYSNASQGLRFILIGLFKKVVIADRLAIYVNSVYGNITLYEGFPLMWAVLFFSIQIYCDFSGYSDIALGAAKVMGFDLMKNFNKPYFSSSIKEFWSRWHISLSAWFKDYLYISLGGNKGSINKHLRNILIVFIISGFWHGASWTFIIWGILHALFQIIEIIINHFKINKWKYFNNKLFRVFKILMIFVIISFAWIFFRAKNFDDAIYCITHLLNINNQIIGVPIFSKYAFILCLFVVLLSFVIDLLSDTIYYPKKINTRAGNYIINFILAFTIVLIGIFEKQEFIYFQF